jgi:urocanate hydratase
MLTSHAANMVVADGSDEAARRLERVFWNDPASGVMRHADAGYGIAIDCVKKQDIELPSITM